MQAPHYSSFSHWYQEGHLAPYVTSMSSKSGNLTLIDALQPAGDMSDPAVPDLVLYQDVLGSTAVRGDLGAGRFDVVSERGGFFIAAPNFANTVIVDSSHQLRGLSFPVASWKGMLEEACGAQFSFDSLVPKGTFASPRIRAAVLQLWRLSKEDEGAPSQLLCQAAACEIFAELCQIAGLRLELVRGGLATWAERRSIDLMQARLADDISLQELASEVNLSMFHFSRMFKRSFGVPPRVYLAQLRLEKSCELLRFTNISITEITHIVGYSSSQAFARAFSNYKRQSPGEYRRAMRDCATK